MPLMGWVAANLLMAKQQPVLMGNDNFTAAPSGMFSTQDGYLNIAANEQKQWEALTEVLGVPELKTDPRFQARDTRKANRKELTPILEKKLKENTTAHWVKALNDREVPSGEILKLDEALMQAQIRHRKSIGEVEVPGIGPVKLFNLSAKFEKTPGSLDSPPPRLSAHTEEILKELGYSTGEMKAFKEKGIV